MSILGKGYLYVVMFALIGVPMVAFFVALMGGALVLGSGLLMVFGPLYCLIFPDRIKITKNGVAIGARGASIHKVDLDDEGK